MESEELVLLVAPAVAMLEKSLERVPDDEKVNLGELRELLDGVRRPAESVDAFQRRCVALAEKVIELRRSPGGPAWMASLPVPQYDVVLTFKAREVRPLADWICTVRTVNTLVAARDGKTPADANLSRPSNSQKKSRPSRSTAGNS